MNIKELISKAIDDAGADGLVSLDLECGCAKDDLAPCECINLTECELAKLEPVPEDGQEEFGHGQWFVPMRGREMGKKEWFDKLGTMAIVPLKAGDFLVVRFKENVTQANFKRTQVKMENFLEEIGHPEVKVLVLGPEVSLDVVRPEREPTVKAGYG